MMNIVRCLRELMSTTSRRCRPVAIGVATCTLVYIAAGSLHTAAQSPSARVFHVRETMGIRRTAYPITAQLTFAKGVLKEAGQMRLTTNSAEVAAQFTAVALWDDQSVQALDVDFNANLDPEEQRRYEIQFGAAAAAAAESTGGLTVEELPEAIQVGSIRFSKSGTPLLASVSYRGEGIGKGPNGLVVIDTAGQRHDLSAAVSPKLEIVKRGPLNVTLRYSSSVPIDGTSAVAVSLILEMPNSKSWVKSATTVRDPARKVRALAIETPFAFESYPWVWDFGTDSGTYGVFRAATDTVMLTQTTRASGTSGWTVETGAAAQRKPYETSAGTRPKVASGWGHFQDAKAAVAFGFERFGRDPGVSSIALDG